MKKTVVVCDRCRREFKYDPTPGTHQQGTRRAIRPLPPEDLTDPSSVDSGIFDLCHDCCDEYFNRLTAFWEKHEEEQG